MSENNKPINSIDEAFKKWVARYGGTLTLGEEGVAELAWRDAVAWTLKSLEEAR
jgi:hypothetical protein